MNMNKVEWVTIDTGVHRPLECRLQFTENSCIRVWLNNEGYWRWSADTGLCGKAYTKEEAQTQAISAIRTQYTKILEILL
jgi:hypothetical protein